MERKDSPLGAEVFKSVIPFFTELFPLVLEKWAEVNDRPILRDLEEDQVRLNRKMERIVNKVRWLYTFLLVLLVWNIFLTIAVVFLLNMILNK